MQFGKFIQNTVYQILSDSAEFCRSYDKNMLAYFFSWTRCTFTTRAVAIQWMQMQIKSQNRN